MVISLLCGNSKDTPWPTVLGQDQFTEQMIHYLSFGTRGDFYRHIGDPYLAKKVNAPTFQEVLGGFNGYHDIPTGHVVSFVHVEPGQGVGRSTAALNASDFSKNPIAENTGYGYPSKGYGHGVLETPFPGLLLYHDSLIKHALKTGKSYDGTTKNMMEWVRTGGGAHLTEITPELVKRVEDWIQNPYDAEAWATAEAKKAGTHLKKGKRNV